MLLRRELFCACCTCRSLGGNRRLGKRKEWLHAFLYPPRKRDEKFTETNGIIDALICNCHWDFSKSRVKEPGNYSWISFVLYANEDNNNSYIGNMKIDILLIMCFAFMSVKSIRAQNEIVISKSRLELYVVNSNGDTLCTMPCGVGKNMGQKKRKGDCKTPEGTFTISMIQNATKWVHDFNDGAGMRKGAYGPWFIRLKTPFAGIGIHGTCFPESIGTRCSEGCVRLKNDDLIKLTNYIKTGDKVIIEKDNDIIQVR